MFKKGLLLLVIGTMLTFVLIACGREDGGSSGTAPAGDGKNVVHMNDTQFVQQSITIKKGESLTLTADTFLPHIISNGSWENNAAKPASEEGAPVIKDVQINGNSSGTAGPFNTAGTFKLYCSIHPGMNLTVIVQ